MGCAWFPSALIGENREILWIFLERSKIVICPCIPPYIDICSRTDLSKIATYSEEEIVKDILIDAVNIDCRPMGFKLGVDSRFLDPKEITDAIDIIKSTPNSHFVGFMSAFDTIELEINNKKFYLRQTNCVYPGVKTYINSMEIIPEIIPRENNPRIFNWMFRISISSLPNEGDTSAGRSDDEKILAPVNKTLKTHKNIE